MGLVVNNDFSQPIRSSGWCVLFTFLDIKSFDFHLYDLHLPQILTTFSSDSSHSEIDTGHRQSETLIQFSECNVVNRVL